LRNFYYKQLADAKEKEAKEMESASKGKGGGSIPKGPNVNVRR
jgi:hypothetical protein